MVMMRNDVVMRGGVVHVGCETETEKWMIRD